MSFPMRKALLLFLLSLSNQSVSLLGGPRLGEGGRLGECWEVARSQHGGTLRGGVHAGGFPFRVYQGRVLIRRATV